MSNIDPTDKAMLIAAAITFTFLLAAMALGAWLDRAGGACP